MLSLILFLRGAVTFLWHFLFDKKITTNETLAIALINDRKFLARDPASIERSNLVNICKLVVKELLEQSLRYGRQLDSDHLPLQHFFIVLEHVLRHGLKPKKGLLGPKKELWDLLQSIEKYCPEAQDVTLSIRDLPTVRTHTGRSRAWLRLALMQKKLADYLQALIEHKGEILVEFYEPHALMLSDEVRKEDFETWREIYRWHFDRLSWSWEFWSVWTWSTVICALKVKI